MTPRPPATVNTDDAGGLLCERLLLAVTGSPAALSVPNYALVMRQTLARDLRVMMTRTAARFVPPETMRLFSGGPIHTDLHEVIDAALVPHVDLTDAVNLMLVMPATANIIGKAAHGICDELVSTAIVACAAPVVFIPSMNERMWRSAVVQRNVAITRELGYHVIEPDVGLQLSDMREGPGLMPPLEHVLGELIAIVRSHVPRLAPSHR